MARFTNGSDVFKHITRTVERAVNDFIGKLNTEARKLTPKRTGRAKKGWRIVNQYKISRTRGLLLENRVPYIGLLDSGWSKQAPRGIVEPAIKKLKRRTKL